MSNFRKKDKTEQGLSIRTKWDKPDTWFIVILMLLNAIGLLFIFDTCYTKAGSFNNGFYQIGFMCLGVLFCIGASLMDLRHLKKCTLPVILLSIVSLIAMLVIGKEVNGAIRWIPIGPINIQPPEFAKVAYVLGLSFLIDITGMFKYKAYLSGYNNCAWFWTISIGLVAIIVCIGISSMSALLTFVFLILLMAFYGNFNRIVLAIFTGVIIIVMACQMINGIVLYHKENPTQEELERRQISEALMLEDALEIPEEQRNEEEQSLVDKYNKLNLGTNNVEKKEVKEEQEEVKENLFIKILSKFSPSGKNNFRTKRMVAWVNPKKYKNDVGLQPAYGLMAISSGGLVGKGLGNGICKFSIPESHNDYIFPTIIEETGFLGGIILIFLYCCLFFRAYKIMVACENNYGKLLCCGALIVLGAEFFINLMVALNIIPSTGVCLPFISYGGTSVVVNFMLAGIILCVSRQKNIPNRIITNYKKNGRRIIIAPYNVLKPVRTTPKPKAKKELGNGNS